MPTIDSDPRTIIVVHGEGARACIDAILGFCLSPSGARRAKPHIARRILLAIGSTDRAELQVTRSGVTDEVLYQRTVRVLLEEGVIKRAEGRGLVPDWLGLARHGDRLKQGA